MVEDYAGRLELTWTNKDKRLLAHEDGSYVWVAPLDYRLAEVRLLVEAESVGSFHRPRRALSIAEARFAPTRRTLLVSSLHV